MPPLPERVWLLRHAETTAPNVFNGSESDVALSELGFRQAEQLGIWFENKNVTAVVSSTMLRAIQTAIPIARMTAAPHTHEPLLRERSIGPLSGQPFAATTGPWIDTIREWSSGNTAFTTERAESFDALKLRLHEGWERIVQAHPGGHVVIVAHGIVCKVLLLTLLRGWSPTGWEKIGKISNAAISEIVPGDDGLWHAERLLEVPEAIANLTPPAPRSVA